VHVSYLVRRHLHAVPRGHTDEVETVVQVVDGNRRVLPPNHLRPAKSEVSVAAWTSAVASVRAGAPSSSWEGPGGGALLQEEEDVEEREVAPHHRPNAVVTVVHELHTTVTSLIRCRQPELEPDPYLCG
jgi:hypothetical protein